MKTYRHIPLIALACLTLLICSCESQYFHDYNVKNETSLSIKLRMFIGKDSTDVSMTAGQEQKLKEYTDQTNDIDTERIVTLYDSIYVYNDAGTIFIMKWNKEADLYKDLNYANFFYQGDWQYELNNTSTVFSLKDEDINIYRTENGLPTIQDVINKVNEGDGTK
ncbi:hypothetical protein K5X82_13120 [Halosquirtibacter xylanolyticus]|uniref:hypothetical protein n=1 Tax=Halosquirtibacter xylanolyticus TaxID=3374599 RepID=UPI00374A7694|nr:hypothetical protein K5X82_13120 [Prolixibacteraceae bacterium]